MTVYESLLQALDALKSNKLRSILTMIGIIMGVFSIITIVALGNAVESYVKAEFQKMGSNLLQVRLNTKSLIDTDWLTFEDIGTIKRIIPEIKNIDAQIQQGGQIVLGSKSRDAQVIGVGSQYKNMFPVEMAAGRMINDIDMSHNTSVAVVDEYFARRYFKSVDAIGEEVTLKSPSGEILNLKICGVTKSNNAFLQSMLDNEDFPTTLIMPSTSLMNFYGLKRIDSIQITIDGDQSKLTATGDRILKGLEFKHRNKNKYTVTSSADMLNSMSKSLSVVSSVLLVIAVITLVVGGVGIVNILLVSVTERIREIGIRKALGATEGDIVIQFLTEAIIITGIGGLIGIALGLAAGNGISYFIHIPPIVNWGTVIFSFIGSIILGIVFGVYPAKKAAELDPIECLRYE
jgi:putative ABC transport system permease protein